MREPPNDRRNFVHKKLLKAAVGFIPGGSTALTIGSAFIGAPQPSARMAPELRNLGLTDARRIAITNAMNAARARGDSREAAAFMKELGSQGALAGLANLGLTDARRRSITNAMNAARARGDSREAAAFLRELGSQGALRSPSIPPPNPVRERVIRAKPMPFIPPSRPRARIPQVFPIGAPAPMPIHRRARSIIGDFLSSPDSQCPPGSFPSPAGCVDPSAALPFGDPLFGAGSPEMGRFGPAYQGTSRMIRRTTCLPGDLVGRDGLCYNRKSLTNKERMWPRGRQPLLTGGEMRAISIATRAAAKFERTQKRLQKIGMIRKPASRARAPKLPPHQHQITSG